MSIQRILAGSSSYDLRGMIEAHVGLHDQRDVNKAQSQASASPRFDPSVPLSAALPHPTRRPSFLKALGGAGSGKSAQRGGSRMHLARHDHGDEAELPDWQQMQTGNRTEGPVPSEAEVSLAADAARRQYLVQQDSATVSAKADARAGFPEALEQLASAARRAVLDRQRACHWLFGSGAGSFPAVA
ncbi:hypothetical protein [Herbaspirillum sp. YR522]|uniref:hypothetical protein n=1 Tax=Herbaspirillum sp. YR522 TaxID=1144342 RepID=UPI00026F9A06|nr:hypothetical protein [Herbaspirillum sp. YR522]EJN02961.1 hypothetical protein PMI40_02914 [Herbaspirillum sp. YR522]